MNTTANKATISTNRPTTRLRNDRARLNCCAVATVMIALLSDHSPNMMNCKLTPR